MKKIMSNQEAFADIKEEMTPKKDYMFKKLFGSVGKEGLVKGFLEAILDIKIASLVLGQETILLPDGIKGKTGVLDVRVTLEDGTIIDIEMQNAKSKFIVERSHFYASRLYETQLKRADFYNKLNKVIVIFIADFNLFDTIKDYHTKWMMTEQNNLNEHFEELELHYIELPKFIDSKYDKERNLDQWLLFIDFSEKEVIKEIMEKNKNIKDAAEELRKLQEEEYLQELAFRERLNEFEKRYNERIEREEREKEREEMKKELAKEKEEMKNETAKRMLRNNIDIETIMIATELTKEEIEELKKSL